ncbi:MAG: PQQ-binding-like beta-propeller repeat protein [Alloacidobacterium sp.]
MKSLRTNREQTASFRILSLMLAITPLLLMLAAANTSAHAQTSNPSPGDWTQFHRDNMQRWNPYETVLGVNNVGSLQLKWRNSLGSEVNDLDNFFVSSPAVVNGVVYVGSGDSNLYALNADTGVALWSYTADNEVLSSPAVGDGAVYVGANDGNLYALNASTGAKLWSYSIGGTPGSFLYSSPAVANGVVYIASDDGNVYALNATTGALLWGSGAEGGVFSSPAVANGVVYFGSMDHNVYALNASTGAKLWSYATGDWVVSSPAVADGVVYIGSLDNNLYALNASTGAKLWSYSTGSFLYSSPAVANGVVYFGSTDSNVYALNASTGAKLWSFTAGANVPSSSPAVANGVVYIGSADHNLYALNASTGAKLWSSGGGPVNSSPVVANGVVYIHAIDPSSGAGNLSAFSLESFVGADLLLRINPSTTTVGQGALITYAFPVWNLGPANADQEVLNTQVPAGTTFDSISISGTPGLGTCTHPGYGDTGPIVCHENSSMAPNTTWTVRLTVKVTAPSGTVITENATTMDTPDRDFANNTATVSTTVLRSADLFLRVQPSSTTVHQGDLITYAFPVWNLGPANADQEVLTTQVPAGSTFDYIRISGIPGLGTCTTPPYQGMGQIVCHENGAMALNTTWTVRLTVKVTAPSGTVITENAATMADTFDPNMANNTATVSLTVVP